MSDEDDYLSNNTIYGNIVLVVHFIVGGNDWPNHSPSIALPLDHNFCHCFVVQCQIAPQSANSLYHYIMRLLLDVLPDIVPIHYWLSIKS